MVDSETPAELHERLGEDDVQVVDIRPERAFRRGHIPGAINVPFARLPQLVEDVDWGDDVVVACPKGESSLQAARMLEAYEGVEEDARVANLEAGYREWEWDLETGDGAAGDDHGGDGAAGDDHGGHGAAGDDHGGHGAAGDDHGGADAGGSPTDEEGGGEGPAAPF